MVALLSIYGAGALVSWVLIAGMQFADLQARFPDGSLSNYREDLGFSLFWGAFAATLWPFFLPGVYCLTGFAQHGWRLR